MNSRSLSFIAIVAFLLLGAVCVGLRYRAVRAEQIAIEDSQWELTYSTQFVAENLQGQEEAQVRLGLPFETRYCDVLDENWVVPNPNLRPRVSGPFQRTQNRLLELSTRQASATPYTATAKTVLRLSPRPSSARAPGLENLTTDARTYFLRDQPPELPKQDPGVRQVAQQAPDESETEAQRLQWIFEYCSGIDSTPESATDAVEQAVVNRRGTPLARARTMVTLCRVLRFPARLVTGFIVRQGATITPHVWVEVFQRQEWVPFDPTNGYSLSLPMNYVPVRRDAETIHDSSPNVANTVSTSYSIRRLTPDELMMRGEVRRITQIFDLTRLPVAMHKVMKILLLLPFAALITAFIRNVIGIGTFGTFAPALLAMSFIYADWETGVAILLVVLTAGLTGRLWLEKLRLLMVPRLAIVLTLVILCVVFSVSTFDFLGVTPSAQAVLLPMVILTTLVERFYVTVEEDGLIYTIKMGVGTFLVAMLCYLVLRWEDVGAQVLRYPEVHFFTIAAFILLGRYAGYRFTELWRFRDLVEPSEPPR